ncbi:hornerin-like isoform X1 [Anopheles funestus]|uniref:hornerin-like isoform X1 n=1 Tax=Anopheles funestus TaxID=62324 RepID=UPI0020C5C1EC|nr:hornerin-like isoform X1 [Anopheles funestus]
MNKLVFVVLCALLVGGALGEAALGNYYKDVVREQHKLINEMNQNFTELEKASEKLIDLGFYVGKHKLPPKTVKITKTVAVKVPVPFPVKVPEPVPVPVPVSKPVPVPVPTLVAIPVESTAATVAAVTLAGSASDPSPSSLPADADPASSQAHASTVQVQEYVQSFPIHSVYDAGDDYNPMEGNRLALAEHTASPTESTFSKPSPSSLQQLEEYQHQYAHNQRHTEQHSQQQKHHQHQKPAQTGSHTGTEHYYRGHGGSGASGGHRQYYVGGAQVQAGANSPAKFRPESHALQSAAESYDFGDGTSQYHTTSFTRATDTPYSTASVVSGGKSAPSASSAISEGYRFASEQQQQQQFQRGQHGGSIFESQQYGRGGRGGEGGGNGGRGGTGESSGGRILGSDIGGVGGTGSDTETGAHSYVKFSEATGIQEDNQASTVPRFQSEGETRLQAGFEAGFQEGLQTTHQAGLEAGLEAGFQAGLQADQGAEKSAHRHGAGSKTKEINDLTPRPFQTVRESYPRYEKPDFGRYHTHSSDYHQRHHHGHDHQDTGRQQQGSIVGGGSGSVLTEGYDHPAFAKSNRPGAAPASDTGAVPTAATHSYTVSGERTLYPKVSSASYHHSHPYSTDLPGEAHKDLHHQTDTTGEPFPFYHATKHDPHLARSALKSYHSDATASGPSYQLRQQYGEHKESQARGTSAQTVHEFHHAGGYNTFTEHHQQHDQFGQKHKGSYGTSAKPTVYSVPSDAHLYPSYNNHDHHHGSGNNGASHSHDHTGTAGKFHYHFHNVHPVGGGTGNGNDHHHQSAASEHQYAVHTELGQYGGVAGPDGSLVTSYDPPASGNTFQLHDDGTGDMLAGASTVQEQQHREPYEESSPYGHTQ